MAKRRRKLPQSQARPSGRELWEQQQALIRRLAESPAFRDLQEQTRRLRDSPFGRASIEQARRLREAQERILREPAPQPKRRKGGGRKRKLTPEEIARLQAAYRAEPTQKQADVFNKLRKLLGRHVGDSTLRYRVVRPLRGNRPSVISARRNKPAR
jgi:murein DD-endopeptidase MepM/ murein hydrolase activator NlpD